MVDIHTIVNLQKSSSVLMYLVEPMLISRIWERSCFTKQTTLRVGILYNMMIISWRVLFLRVSNGFRMRLCRWQTSVGWIWRRRYYTPVVWRIKSRLLQTVEPRRSYLVVSLPSSGVLWLSDKWSGGWVFRRRARRSLATTPRVTNRNPLPAAYIACFCSTSSIVLLAARAIWRMCWLSDTLPICCVPKTAATNSTTPVSSPLIPRVMAPSNRCFKRSHSEMSAASPALTIAKA